MPAHILPRPRVDELRAALPTAVDLLHRRRAAQIPIDHLEAYIDLDWLKWDGGLLRLTSTGENIQRQTLEQVAAA